MTLTERPCPVLKKIGSPLVWMIVCLGWSSAGRGDDVPAAPDYSRASVWAALPTKKDYADHVPPGSGLKDRQRQVRADAFYVHPTTFFSRRAWNAPVDDAALNRETDQRCLQFQASVFNGAARVYAPRYRQANGFAFVDRSGAGERAVALAYSDVRRAFQYYLRHYNQNRPIILAGHSQGSTMIVRLLKEFFDGKPLQKRLVVAYIVGEFVGEDTFRQLPFGKTPHQTGCFVSWCTVQKGKRPRLVCGSARYGNFAPFTVHTQKPVCINPLTWSHRQPRATFQQNLGAAPDTGLLNPALEEIVPGLVGATCRDGIVWIDTSRMGLYKLAFGHEQGDYHLSDYELFYVNIRRNAARRVAAYLKQHGQ